MLNKRNIFRHFAKVNVYCFASSYHSPSELKFTKEHKIEAPKRGGPMSIQALGKLIFYACTETEFVLPFFKQRQTKHAVSV